MINALNSGAKVFMADFEDSNSPTWQNVIGGQVSLPTPCGARSRSITGRQAVPLNDDARRRSLVRPRGWHLVERHFEVDGEPISG